MRSPGPRPIQRILPLILGAFASVGAFAPLACVSKPVPREEGPGTSIKLESKASPTPASSPAPEAAAASPAPAREPSLAARIEGDLAFASLSSLSEAEGLVRANKAQDSEFGRAALYAAYQLRKRLYPETLDPQAELDPPPLNALVRVLQDTEKGKYPDAPLRSASRLAALLSATVLIDSQDAESIRAARADLAKLAADDAPPSPLAAYLLALDAERRKDWAAALSGYERTESLSPEWYPAGLGRARIYFATGRAKDAVALLERLSAAHPDSPAISRLLAKAYYDSGKYEDAAPLIQSVLRSDPTDDAFIAMRAHILILAGNYLQAGPLLDAYATRNPRDPLYLYLRGLSLWKEGKDRARALDFLKGADLLYPRDRRIALLLAAVYLDGDEVSSQDRQSARSLLEALLLTDPRDKEALVLLARDALAVGSSSRALSYLDELLAADPAFSDYALMTEIAFAAKEAKRAAAWADAWFAAAPADDAAALAKARSLLDSGKGAQALALINDRLAKHPPAKSSAAFFYLRSRLQKDPEALLGDLRSSLMEDPRNLDAILAMFDAYYGQKDYKKAQFYLRQAQAAAPSSAEVASRTKTLGNLASQ